MCPKNTLPPIATYSENFIFSKEVTVRITKLCLGLLTMWSTNRGHKLNKYEVCISHTVHKVWQRLNSTADKSIKR